MKIAKHVLAVIMAAAMICCMIAFASAAGNPELALSAGTVADGKVTVDLVLKNAANVGSFNAIVNYDTSALQVASKRGNPDVATSSIVNWYNNADEGLDAKISLAANDLSGSLKLGLMMQDNFYSASELTSKCEEWELTAPAGYDDSAVTICTITFKVADGATGSTQLTLSDVKIGLKSGESFNNTASATIVISEEAEPTTEAPVVEPTTKAPVVEPTTKVPVVEPTTKAPVVEPTTKAPVVEPTTKAPVVEPTTKAPVVEPTTKAPTVVPTTKAPTVVPTTAAPKNPTTGDNNVHAGDNMALAAAAGVVALAGAAFVIARKKKIED